MRSRDSLAWVVLAALSLAGVRGATADDPRFAAFFGDGRAVAVRSGPGGDLFVLGVTTSDALPARNALQPHLAPGDCDGRLTFFAPCPDLFVARLSSDGSLKYLTYLGGAEAESAAGFAVDADGAAYVAGFTQSPDFPVTHALDGPAVSLPGPFLAKLAPDGGRLLASIALPAAAGDLALAEAGPVFVGRTANPNFPVVNAPPAVLKNTLFYRSRDGGATWELDSPGAYGPAQAVAAVPGRLYLVADDVLVSVDGGRSWRASGFAPVAGRASPPPFAMRRSRLAIRTDNPLHAFAVTRDRLLATSDGGATWADRSPSISPGERPVAVALGAPGVVYAATEAAVYRSGDSGATWMASAAFGGGIPFGLVVDPSDPETVYATRTVPGARGGASLWLSRDGARGEWIERRLPAIDGVWQMLPSALAFAPGGLSRLVAVVGAGLFESLDGGTNWNAVRPDHSATDGEFAFDPRDPARLFYFAGDVLLSSRDGGATFDRIAAQPLSAPASAVVVDPLDPAALYAGAARAGFPPLGDEDAFAMGLTADLRSIRFSTRLVGADYDEATAVLVEPSGDVLVAGVTSSPDFPRTAGAAAQAYAGGTADLFVTRLSGADRSIVSSTLLGGPGREDRPRLALGPGGAVFVAASSDSLSFLGVPTPPENEFARVWPVVAALSGDLSAVRYVRRIQDDRDACGPALTVDSSGRATVAIQRNDVRSCADAGGVGEVLVRLDAAGAVERRAPIAAAAAGLLAVGEGLAVAGGGRMGGFWVGPEQPVYPDSPPTALLARFAWTGDSADSPTLTAALDAAGLNGGPLAPGLIGSLFGAGLGPEPGLPLRIEDGRIVGRLGETRVLVDGRPVPLLYAGSNQVNFIAPFDLGLGTLARIEVESEGRLSGAVLLPVVPSNAGLFAADGSGRGALAALNQDGTVNARSNPAAAGSVVSLFGAGAGEMTPQPGTGEIAAPRLPLPAPNAGVSVRVGGRPARVLYAGAAPGLALGVLQFNVEVPPETAAAGDAAVEVEAGGASGRQRDRVWISVGPSTAP